MKDKLYRSRTKRVIGGVAAGLAEYIKIDPILARIIFVVLVIIHGLGILLYIILWIVIPEEPLELAHTADEKKEEKPDPAKTPETEPEGKTETKPRPLGFGRVIAGIILISLGIIFLVERFFPYFDFIDFMPIILILFGIVLLWNSVRK